MEIFQSVSDDTIKKGNCIGAYYSEMERILRNDGRDPDVVAEISARTLKDGWGIFCGLNDALRLLDGINLNVYAMQEGSIFYAGEPVMRIQGPYLTVMKYLPSVIGLISKSSAIAASSFSHKISAHNKWISLFCPPTIHPAFISMINRSAWVGGIDAVCTNPIPAGIPQAELMPSAFTDAYEEPDTAWLSFASTTNKSDNPRFLICDIRSDYKREALLSAKTGCGSVCINCKDADVKTISSVIDEIKWEFCLNSYEEPKIILYGNFTADDTEKLSDFADGFCIGNSIADAPAVDFSSEIVEISGIGVSHCGSKGGVKEIYEADDGTHIIFPINAEAPAGVKGSLLKNFIRNGQVLNQPDILKSRFRVLSLINIEEIS